MSRRYEREEDERRWRRPDQNWQSRNRWSEEDRDQEYGWGGEGQYGRNWGGGWQGSEYGNESQWQSRWNRPRMWEREPFGGMRRGSGEGQYAGLGPRGYKRSDNRIEEDVNDRLTQHPWIDATDIEVSVQNGEVTLRGHVDTREAKRMAEDLAESVFGVKEVHNEIRLKHRGEREEGSHETEPTGKQRKAS